MAGGEPGERWLVVGLGNPGPAYAGNRHNVGALVADLLATRTGSRWRSHRSRAHTVETRLAGRDVVLAKPAAYMNESGGPVGALVRYFRSSPDRLVVIHDELDLPYGTLRLKRGGGDNGHNGLRSVRQALGSGEFYRVRVGIGRPPGRMDPADFVLRDFSPAERRDLGVHLDRAADAVETVLSEGLDVAQNRYNTPPTG